MTQDLEKISSICDNEGWDGELVRRVAKNPSLASFWHSTHIVRDVLQSQPDRSMVDISAAVAQALEHESSAHIVVESFGAESANIESREESGLRSSNVVAGAFGHSEPTEQSVGGHEDREKRPSWARKWLQQGGQFAVAASFAAFAIIGYQEYYQQNINQADIDAPGIPQIGMPQGGLAPVSLATTRPVTTPTSQPVTQAEMEALLEERRRLNAIIAHHQQQVRNNASSSPAERADN